MEGKKTPSENTAVKKTYEQPRIISEEVFETLALACCKSNACRVYGFPKGQYGTS